MGVQSLNDLSVDGALNTHKTKINIWNWIAWLVPGVPTTWNTTTRTQHILPTHHIMQTKGQHLVLFVINAAPQARCQNYLFSTTGVTQIYHQPSRVSDHYVLPWCCPRNRHSDHGPAVRVHYWPWPSGGGFTVHHGPAVMVHCWGKWQTPHHLIRYASSTFC